MSYKFYRLLASVRAQKIQLSEGHEVKIFSPGLTKLSLHSRNKPIYFFWYFLTLGRYKIYYVFDGNDNIVHYSNVMPKIYKYDFMPRRKSIHIGPCWTSKDSRGKGIYPAVLSKICQDYCDYNRYIFTHKNNIASCKGIEKVKFEHFANGYKSKPLGIYKIKSIQ